VVSDIDADQVLARLDPAERRAVEEFHDRVRELFGPRLRDMRLFGSKVRGEDHPESDIDVLVLVDDCTWSDNKAVLEIASAVESWLEPHLEDFERYHAPRSRATGFYKEMRKESVRL
jgi:predicted nucleotidyltransferase